MINSGDIIKVINTILCEHQLKKHQWPLHIKSSKFGPPELSRYWLRKILLKLEAEKYIFDIVALNSSNEWHFAIADINNDHTISFRTNTEKLKEYKNNLLTDEQKALPPKLSHREKSGIVCIKSKSGKNVLKFNKMTGDFQLNKIKGNFPPDGQEYNFITAIVNNENYQNHYLHLIQSVINLNIERVSKANKMDIAFVLRNIKNKMKILPKNKAKNENIFKNQKNFGYRIIVK